MSTWRVSVRGSTSYVLVTASTREEALFLGATRLGIPVDDLECDLSPTKLQEVLKRP